MTLEEAIAHREGYYVSGSRANRNNNPGNLQWGAFAIQHGATCLERTPPGELPRFAVFPTPEVGFAALHALLSGPAYADLTIEQAINKYAPPNENNTSDYLSYVCENVGCKATDLVSEVLG